MICKLGEQVQQDPLVCPVMMETDTHDQTGVLLIHWRECPGEGTARGILSSGPN
jgi:hypothetical protein